MNIAGFIAYVKQLWKNKPDTSTPLSAERMLHIEEGIKRNSDAIEAIAAAVVDQITNDSDKIASMAALHAVNQQLAQVNSNLGRTHSKYVDNITIPAREWTDANVDLTIGPGTYVIILSCRVDTQSGKYVGWQFYDKTNGREIGGRGFVIPPDNNIFWGQSVTFTNLSKSTVVTARCWTATGIENIDVQIDALKIK